MRNKRVKELRKFCIAKRMTPAIYRAVKKLHSSKGSPNYKAKVKPSRAKKIVPTKPWTSGRVAKIHAERKLARRAHNVASNYWAKTKKKIARWRRRNKLSFLSRHRQRLYN